MPYVQLVGMLSNKSNDALNGWAVLDEETGEIKRGYPEIGEWNEQVEAFFRDEFAARKAGFSFGYFLKQFGTFVKFEPAQVKKSAQSAPVFFYCPKCKKNVDQNHFCD